MAAGLGFKTFNTGDVLTAADTNGYLMQGVLVFDDAAARDAAITAPAEGQFAYLKDTNVTTYYTGSAWANLDTTGMVNPMTTTGDTIYSSSGSTPARLGIGSTGNVLTVAGGVPTWAAPAGGGGADFTLLNAGGTTLSGSTTTVSGISGQNTLLVIIENGGISAANRNFRLRINTDTTTKYFYHGINISNPTSYAIGFLAGATGNDTYYPLGATSSNSATTFASGTFIYGANTTNLKVIDTCGAGAIGGGNTTQSFITKGYYSGTATVSSISIYSDGTFNAGKVYVYGSAV
jgi:hypothetical protein